MTMTRGEQRKLTFPPHVWQRLEAMAEARSMKPERLVVELLELQLVEMKKTPSRGEHQLRASSPAASMMTE